MSRFSGKISRVDRFSANISRVDRFSGKILKDYVTPVYDNEFPIEWNFESTKNNLKYGKFVKVSNLTPDADTMSGLELAVTVNGVTTVYTHGYNVTGFDSGAIECIYYNQEQTKTIALWVYDSGIYHDVGDAEYKLYVPSVIPTATQYLYGHVASADETPDVYIGDVGYVGAVLPPLPEWIKDFKYVTYHAPTPDEQYLLATNEVTRYKVGTGDYYYYSIHGHPNHPCYFSYLNDGKWGEPVINTSYVKPLLAAEVVDNERHARWSMTDIYCEGDNGVNLIMKGTDPIPVYGSEELPYNYVKIAGMDIYLRVFEQGDFSYISAGKGNAVVDFDLTRDFADARAVCGSDTLPTEKFYFTFEGQETKLNNQAVWKAGNYPVIWGMWGESNAETVYLAMLRGGYKPSSNAMNYYLPIVTSDGVLFETTNQSTAYMPVSELTVFKKIVYFAGPQE